MSKKILVLCEKTEQAKALKEGLPYRFETKEYKNKYNKTKIPNLYYKSNDVTIVSARGHLLTLCDVNDYVGIEDCKSWIQLKDYIPYIPDNFKYKFKGSWETGQLELINKLIKSNEFDVIYNFGDPDAEGELLIREILSYTKNTIPVMRIECKSLVPSVVAQAFNEPKGLTKYNELYFEALARQQTDWLNGVNLTTMLSLSLATNDTLQVGRVLTSIVRFVYDSDKAIENFVPTNTWGVNLKYKDVSIPSKTISFEEKDNAKAEELVKLLNSNPTVVKSIETKEKTLEPKRLYTTAKLLADLNKLYKIKMKEASDAMEKLYLEAYITYPRTDCEYLQTREIPQMQNTVERLEGLGLPVAFHTRASVFNDKKCGGAGEGGHTAIVITGKIPNKEEMSKFSEVEKAVYSLVYRRTISNFCEKATVKETKIVFENSGYEFSTTGSIVLNEGFLKFENKKFNDISIFKGFNENDTIDCNFEKVTRTTKAPPKANAARLVYYLQHPFEKTVKEAGGDESEDFYSATASGITIGTGSTMETTTTKAIKYGYFTEDKKGYTITPKGKFLIEALDKLGIDTVNPEKTIEINVNIKKVSKKLMTLEQNKENIKNQLLAVKEILDYNDVPTFEGEVIGECPLCKSPVVDTKKVYKCANPECKFVLFKEDMKSNK